MVGLVVLEASSEFCSAAESSAVGRGDAQKLGARAEQNRAEQPQTDRQTDRLEPVCELHERVGNGSAGTRQVRLKHETDGATSEFDSPDAKQDEICRFRTTSMHVS